MGLLKQRQIAISMSRKGNPYDNAFCESFMKTLKYEEVHRQEYRDPDDARASIGHFPERVYNQKRPHSALGYRAPAKFETGLAAATGALAGKRLCVFSGMAESIVRCVFLFSALSRNLKEAKQAWIS